MVCKWHSTHSSYSLIYGDQDEGNDGTSFNVDSGEDKPCWWCPPSAPRGESIIETAGLAKQRIHHIYFSNNICNLSVTVGTIFLSEIILQSWNTLPVLPGAFYRQREGPQSNSTAIPWAWYKVQLATNCTRISTLFATRRRSTRQTVRSYRHYASFSPPVGIHRK